MTHSELSEHLENYKALGCPPWTLKPRRATSPVTKTSRVRGRSLKDAVIRNYTELFIRNIMRLSTTA